MDARIKSGHDISRPWQCGGFTCKSEPSGITCFNADRNGFSLSRSEQKAF
jgi:hypothetical protein